MNESVNGVLSMNESVNGVLSMNESVRKHALEKIAVNTAAVGGVSGATLGAAIGSALRYSSEPEEEQSVLTNPIMLGALGAGIGTIGGAAIDAIPTNKPSQPGSFDDSLREGLRSGIGRPVKSMLSSSSTPGLTSGALLGSAAGLYGIGAYAGNAHAREIIQKFNKKFGTEFNKELGRAKRSGKPVDTDKIKASVLKSMSSTPLYNKYIKALVTTGQLEDKIINTTLAGSAKNLGLIGDTRTGKTLAFLRRMRSWNPVRALSLGLVEAGERVSRPNGWLRSPKTNIKNRISAFKALPGRKAKIKAGLKGGGKAAGLVATLISLGMLGKQVFSED